MSVLTPFTAFLFAELVDASGVLAVVICGLTLSQIGPRLIRADTRQQSGAFWQLATCSTAPCLSSLDSRRPASCAT